MKHESWRSNHGERRNHGGGEGVMVVEHVYVIMENEAWRGNHEGRNHSGHGQHAKGSPPGKQEAPTEHPGGHPRSAHGAHWEHPGPTTRNHAQHPASTQEP